MAHEMQLMGLMEADGEGVMVMVMLELGCVGSAAAAANKASGRNVTFCRGGGVGGPRIRADWWSFRVQ